MITGITDDHGDHAHGRDDSQREGMLRRTRAIALTVTCRDGLRFKLEDAAKVRAYFIKW